MVHVARAGETVGRRQAPDALGPERLRLLRAYAPPDDRLPPALLGLLGEADGYVNAGLTESYLIKHANQVVFIAAQQFSKRLPERFLRRRSHDLIVSRPFWVLYQRTFLIDPNDENGRRNPYASDIQSCRFVRHSVLHLLLWQTFKLPGCGAVRHSSRFR